MSIFTSLGINESLFIQFAIVIALYYVLKVLLFSKLQYVIELRENRTTKLESLAGEKFKEAQELAQKYQTQLNDAHDEAYRLLTKKKEEVINREQKIIKTKENELNTLVETGRQKNETLIQEKRTEIFKNVDSLSGELVNKLIQ